MKIALMTNNYKPVMGGVPISIERLAKGLEALGHQVTIFAPTYQGQKEEGNVVRYGTLLKRFVGGIVLPNPFDPKIEEEFQKGNYDIIHVHHPMLIGRMAVYLSKKYDVPLVFTYHTRYEQYLKCYTHKSLNWEGFMKFYLHSFLKNCSFVFAPTEGMKQYLRDVCHVSSEKIGILPTGLERSHFEVDDRVCEEIRKTYHAENIPLLLSVSRMANEKNVEFLLNSIAKVKELYQEPFKVLLVGDGPDRMHLEECMRGLGLREEVIFAGSVPNEEIAPYFKAADGFIFASKTETQGIVVLEAFAGETPVIALNATGVEDLVKNGVNGILTEENVDSYARKLAGFLKDAAWQNFRYRALQKGAGESALLYREEAVALKAEHYYNDVVAEFAMQKKGNVQKWIRDIAY